MLDGDFATDVHESEPEELRVLQNAYRQRVQAAEQLYHPLSSTDALEAKVLKLRDDLGQLRRGVKRWALAVVALLGLAVGIGLWQMKNSSATSQKVAIANTRLASVEEKLNALLKQGVEKFPETEAKVRQEQPGQKSPAVEDKAYSDLAKQLGVDEKDLREKLPGFARQLQNSPKATTFERANAAYVAKDYAEAGRLALLAAKEAREAKPSRIANAIKAFELAGWSAEKRIEYSDALHDFRDAEMLTDKLQDFAEWERVQQAITVVLYDEGKYHEVEIILNGIATECAQVLGSEHPDSLSARHYYARALLSDGQFKQAETEYRELISLREKVLGPEHPDTLRSRNNLAFALDAQGKYAEAEAEDRALLALFEKSLGPKHPDTLRSRNNLAIALDDQGKYAEAESEYRALLVVKEELLGQEHPDTLSSRTNLANSLAKEGKYAEAEAEDHAVLALYGRVLGPEHPDTLRSRSNLANVLDDQGKHPEAEAEYRAVLVLRKKVLGPEHPNTLSTEYNLALCLKAQNKTTEAAGFAQRAAQGAHKSLGDEHPLTKQYEELSQELQVSK